MGSEHIEVANELALFGGFYFGKREYEKAEPLVRRALIIQDKILQPRRPDIINSLSRDQASQACARKFNV